MIVNVPQSEYPLTRIIVTFDGGMVRSTCESTFKTVDIRLPDGVAEDDVTIVAQFLDHAVEVRDEQVLFEPSKTELEELEEELEDDPDDSDDSDDEPAPEPVKMTGYSGVYDKYYVTQRPKAGDSERSEE